MLYKHWKNELTDLINQPNQTSLDPTVVTIDIRSGSSSAAVTANVSPNAPLYGPRSINYLRRDIALAFDRLTAVVDITELGTLTYAMIVESINTRYGLNFDLSNDFDDDFIDRLVSASEIASLELILPFADTSPTWFGELPVTLKQRVMESMGSLYLGAATMTTDTITVYPYQPEVMVSTTINLDAATHVVDELTVSSA